MGIQTRECLQATDCLDLLDFHHALRCLHEHQHPFSLQTEEEQMHDGKTHPFQTQCPFLCLMKTSLSIYHEIIHNNSITNTVTDSKTSFDFLMSDRIKLIARVPGINCISIVMMLPFLALLVCVLAKEVPLSNWQFRIPNKTVWTPAYVPSTVHLDLLDNKLIKDPYFGSNLMDLYWIETEDVQYSTNFSVDVESLASLNQYIVFQGLDTHCDVILNNKTILHANNMFRKWKVPVELKQTNNLTIYFYSSVKYDLQQEKQLLSKQGFRLPANYSFSRKAAYQYGWDWGPRLVTAGIWKRVYIEAYNYTYIDSIYIRNPPVDQNTTALNLTVQLELLDLNPDSKYLLELSTTDNISKATNFSIPKQSERNLTFTKELQVEDIKLWWTQDIGTPQLYTLVVQVFENDQYLFNKTQRFGIRTVTVSQRKDSLGTSFTIVLNGKYIFMRGGNYIPPDMFMPRALKNPGVYDQVIKSSLFANYNMLRVWGGGQFQFDIFYDKCDEAGFLIWHDLMFACAMYPGSEEIYTNIENEMIDNLKRLRNHPSIALWNGNNQVWIGWQQWGWQSNKTPQQLSLIQSWYNQIFRVVLPQTISKYDTDRFYWQTSPSSSSNSLSTIHSGDIHFWQVWGAGADIQLYSSYIGRFNSQYGMQSMLQYSSILKFTSPEDRHLNSYVMRLHERHILGDQYLPLYVENYAARVTNTTTLQSFSYFSQAMQAFAIKTAIDALRTDGSCMGSLYWQLNDVWPVSSWSTVDFYGMYKAAHYVARDSYQLVYATMVFRNNSYDLCVVNDDIKTVSGTLRYTILDFEGNVLKPTKSNSYFMAAGRRTISQSIPKSQMNSYVTNYSNAFVKIQFDSTKSLSNIFYFVRPILSVNKSPSLTLAMDGNKLSVSSNGLARWVYVYRKDGKSLPLQNNYFDIPPKSTVSVQVPQGTQVEDIGVLEYYNLRNQIKSEIHDQ